MSMTATTSIRKRITHATADAYGQVNHELARLSKTLHWADAEMPHWQKDNEFIISGYRRAQHHWRGTFQSVFGYLHNETVNIHSHLWGAALFLYISFAIYAPSRFPDLSLKDFVVFQTFLFTTIFSLGASAFFHTSLCHSEEMATRCNALDYLGILVQIVGSFAASIYYGFLCHPHHQLTYCGILVAAGFAAGFVVLNPLYQQPTHRTLRTVIFTAVGWTGGLATAQAWWTHGWDTFYNAMGYKWLLLAALTNLTGAFLYAHRFPERLAPGRFDYFFSSHQILHGCVILAALSHFVHVSTCMHWWYEVGNQATCSA
ncbi:HlyIII-domain-containing protein [Cylindrobasidium torrendii FP15055 ss-10]|uniref:HlyIII-domain-containing protein n=1 Tax=Cylindrobasidium torrendii FP15055 ss-10 TaxID=1314674 RepID=A0A0D7BJX4_9AGAR|nr:HlyIII-domain-containing protein [Cylindrobasidium torrendii FP15055 ss-10]